MYNEKPQYGRLAVDKYLDIRYCDEIVFEYLGTNTYKAVTNYILEEDVNSFHELLENADTQWSSFLTKIRHHSGVYRDAYIKIRKQKEPKKGIQLWDIHAYDIDYLIQAYHNQMLTDESLKTLINLIGVKYFRYEHDTNVISFYKKQKAKAVPLFSMDLEQWAAQSISSEQIATSGRNTLLQFCHDLKSGKKEIFASMGSTLASDSPELLPCRFVASTIYSDNIPQQSIGCVTSEISTPASAQRDGDIDPLTGLYSKQAIAEHAAALIQETTGNVALFILDVDNFKDANDNFGHMFGDKVLVQIAEIIADVIGDDGVAGKFGGDEFMGVIANYADRDELKGKLRSIRSRIEFLYANVPNLNITCSIGACEREPGIEDYNALFAHADKSLYLAKDKGKNRYVIYLKDLHGSLIMDEGKIADLKAPSQNTNILATVNDIILTLHKGGYDSLKEAMQKVITGLDYDRISVYYGDGFPKVFCCETVKSASDHAFFATNQEYMAGFGEDGILIYTMIHRLQELDIDIYDLYTKQRTENFVQLRLGPKEHPRGFISFECCHLTKKRSENILNYISIIANLMGNIIEERSPSL